MDGGPAIPGPGPDAEGDAGGAGALAGAGGDAGAGDDAEGDPDADAGADAGADADADADAGADTGEDAGADGEAGADEDAGADEGAGADVVPVGDGAAVGGQVVMPLAGLPGPGVIAATCPVKQAATATPFASTEVETWFCTPNEPQFRLPYAACSRAARNVNRVSPVSAAGLGAARSRLTSCCSRLAWMSSMSAQ